MLPIPQDVLAKFNAVLKQRAVPERFHVDYRKWLLFYLDFRIKYHPPDSRSEQVRLFIEKLQKKNQSPEQQKQAAHALSLYFESQNDRTKAEPTPQVTTENHNSPHPPLILRGGEAEPGGVTITDGSSHPLPMVLWHCRINNGWM